MGPGWTEMRYGKVKAIRSLSLLKIPRVGTPVTLEAKTQSVFWRINKDHMSPGYTGHVTRLSCCRQAAL